LLAFTDQLLTSASFDLAAGPRAWRDFFVAIELGDVRFVADYDSICSRPSSERSER